MFAAAAAALPSAPAAAQMSQDGAPLPRVTMVDKAGVDLRSGRRTHIDGVISIGAADAPALQYTQGAEGGGGLPLWGYVYYHCIPMNGYPCGGGAFPEFVLGARTEWVLNGSGSRLTDGSEYSGSGQSGYVLQDKQGAKWTFAPVPGHSGQSDGRMRTAYLTSIHYSSGEVLTYHYASVPSGYKPSGGQSEKPAVTSITSNSGYQLKIEKPTDGSTVVRLINKSVLYCDAVAASCPTGGVSWPTAVVQPGGSVTFSGLRTVTYGPHVRGAQIRTTATGTAVYEYHQTSTSGAGVERTYTTGSIADGGDCSYQYVVRRIATPDGAYTYSYTAGWNTTISSFYTQSYGCTVMQATSTAPDLSTVSRTGDSVKDELDRVTSHTFSEVYWPRSSTSPAKRELASVTFPEGNKTTFSYDVRLNHTGSTLAPKLQSSEPTLSWGWTFPASCTEATYATCNQPSRETDPEANGTDYTYDPVHGGVLTTTLPADSGGVRPQVRYAYEQRSAKVLTASGALVDEAPIWKLISKSSCRTQANCAGTADEVVTSYTYDDNLLVKTETTRAGDWSVSSTVTRTYDHVGNVVLVDGTAGGSADTTRYVYDALRRLVATMSPDPDGTGAGAPLPVLVTRTTYNGDNQPTLVESGTAADQSDAALAAMSVAQAVQTTYDTSGRKAKESVIAGGAAEAVTQYAYDAASRLECVAVRMNKAAYASLPASACTLGPSGTFGPDRITRNVYNPAGELVTVQKAYGVTTANGFPATLQQNYAGYTYTLNGKRDSVTDANGNKAAMVYDGLDRQTHWRFPSKSSPGAVSSDDYEQYGYDLNGNRVSRRKRDTRTITYIYDALNRATSKTVPVSASGAPGYSVHYGYELGGLQRFARFGSASGEGVTNVYDALGRLRNSTTNLGGVSRWTASEFDAGGKRTQLTTSSGYTLNYVYDGLDRMKAVQEAGPNVIASFGYDALGRRSSLELGSGGVVGSSAAYGYDTAGRLQSLGLDLAGTADQTLTFAYNPASQMVTRTSWNDAYASNIALNVSRPYTVNGLNQYVTAGAAGGTQASFTYDANGNLQSDGSTNYVYDADNRLVSASGAKTASLAYDPLGRLWQVSGGAAGTTRFVYDGDKLVEEYDGAGTRLRAYAHGPAVDEALVWYELTGGPMRRFLHANHQGSIVAVADEGGNALGINAYDPWGIPNASNLGRFAYTGQTRIDELGMYYYKARIYSPTLGRFPQTDPIGYDDQVNLYAYVSNDPVNKTDPDGQQEALVLCAGGPVPCVAGAAITAVKALTVAVGIYVASSGSDVPASDRRVNKNNNGGPPLEDPPEVKVATPTDQLVNSRQLDQRTLSAARAELRGQVVARRPDGTPYDHVTKVRNAQQGLQNRIEQINNRLGHPRLSNAERSALTQELAKASNKLDETRRYVPR